MARQGLMMRAVCALVLILIIASPAHVEAQRRALPAVMGGVMKGREIEARLDDGRIVRYGLHQAEVIDGRLRFTGGLSIISSAGSRRTGAGRRTGGGSAMGTSHVTAMLVGTTARASNPIPRATDASAPRRNAQPAMPATGERNEQTQSLYAQAEAGSGCELIFLKVHVGGAEPVQLGVVLAHQDNQLGEEINRAICRVRRALDAKADAGSALDALNRLLRQ